MPHVLLDHVSKTYRLITASTQLHFGTSIKTVINQSPDLTLKTLSNRNGYPLPAVLLRAYFETDVYSCAIRFSQT